MSLWFLLLLAAWLVAMSAYDLRTRQAPNWLTIPPLLAILAWQLAHRQWQVLLPLPVIYTLWSLHILGGADAKVLMALFALWPRSDFVIFFCAGYVIVAIPVLLLRRHKARAQGRRVAEAQGFSLAALFPTEEDLETQGTPAIPMYALITLMWGVLRLVRGN